MFRVMVITQHHATIKCFSCDLSGEYTSNKLSYILLVLILLNKMMLLVRS